MEQLRRERLSKTKKCLYHYKTFNVTREKSLEVRKYSLQNGRHKRGIDIQKIYLSLSCYIIKLSAENFK